MVHYSNVQRRRKVQQFIACSHAHSLSMNFFTNKTFGRTTIDLVQGSVVSKYPICFTHYLTLATTTTTTTTTTTITWNQVLASTWPPKDLQEEVTKQLEIHAARRKYLRISITCKYLLPKYSM